MMASLPVSIRRDKQTGRAVLFFWNSNPRGHWLECFDRTEGHNKCSREYMQHQCLPLGPHDSDGAELAEFWESIGPDRTDVRIVARLQRPRLGVWL